MLRSLKELKGYKISAKDGEIGKVSDFYFDDHTWKIRYMIANTGNWLISNEVLISPHSLNKPDWENELLPVNLTKEQIEKSPAVEKDSPVSRMYEIELAGYYGWPNYWTGIGGPVIGAIPPSTAYPSTKTEEEMLEMKKEEREKKHDPNLKSSDDVINYNIHAADGDIGHVEDFLIDDNEWDIRYMVVDTKNWLPGKKVIVALPWINKIEWFESKVYVDLSKDKIENSPEYDPESPLEREYENKLHTHYGRERYWK